MMSEPMPVDGCPLMGRLVLLMAEARLPRDAAGREHFLEALAELEVEASEADRAPETVSAIRAVRMLVHIPDCPTSRPPRGH